MVIRVLVIAVLAAAVLFYFAKAGLSEKNSEEQSGNVATGCIIGFLLFGAILSYILFCLGGTSD